MIDILITIAYLAVGFIVSVLFRAFDKKPADDDDFVYMIVMFLWPVAIFFWLLLSGLKGMLHFQTVASKKLKTKFKKGKLTSHKLHKAHRGKK